MPLFWIIVLVLGGAAVAYTYAKASPPNRARPPLRLDPRASLDERRAVTFAFYYEKDPQSLRDFSQALLPDLPTAAALLQVKAAKMPAVKLTPPIPPVVEVLRPFPGGGLNPGRISGQPRVTIGLIYDIDNYTDFASDVVSTSVDVLTHPADTASGAWKIITHPADSISDFADALVDALHAIPGMDEAGELLKDFARTSFGKWSLEILATFGYYVMAPYVGAQLAAVSFAAPGLARACPFVSSWIEESIDRVIQTAKIVLSLFAEKRALADINPGNRASEAVNKALAESPEMQAFARKMMEEIGRAIEHLKNQLGEDISKRLKDLSANYCGRPPVLNDAINRLNQLYGSPPDFEKMAKEMGVREDNAAAAYDLIAQTHYQTTTAWDRVVGEDILAHLARNRFQPVQKPGSPPPKIYRDPRLLNVQEALARRAQSIAKLLYPSSRQKWVEYYLNRQRYAEAGVMAKEITGQSVAVSGFGTISNTVPPNGGIIRPGIYLMEIDIPNYRYTNPEIIVQTLAQYGVTSQLLPSQPGPLYRVVAEISRPLRTTGFLPRFNWKFLRKL